MGKFNRRTFLAFVSALIPSALLGKAEAAASPYGSFLAKSTAIKLGQTQIYGAKDSNGRSFEVVLTRTRTGVTALEGTCTHQGCLVDLKKNSLVCPCHGSVFNPASGAVIMGPNGSSKSSIKPLTKYKVTEKSGKIYIK
ncbi:MAG: Rieske (2Fe-2S) protein [Actinobacteria bacterium]|nr:Rieske (2Fe-2S) protein [Actinomycetota bacterium]